MAESQTSEAFSAGGVCSPVEALWGKASAASIVESEEATSGSSDSPLCADAETCALLEDLVPPEARDYEPSSEEVLKV